MSKMKYRYIGSSDFLVGTGCAICFNEGAVLINSDRTTEVDARLAKALDSNKDFERVEAPKPVPRPAPKPKPVPKPVPKPAPVPKPKAKEETPKPATTKRRRRTSKVAK